MSYVQTATDSVGISVHAGSAFPMAVIRLPENEIIWGNPSFFAITGLSDTACYQTLDSVISGFSTSWLREGQSELPGDATVSTATMFDLRTMQRLCSLRRFISPT